ncbi:esterase/lipase family protein [Aeromonas sp. HMWF014]|uniref:esterase/lipase family protein n=1 Tax=Aeromonas sp. HMWF014 TaxID=2056850 RepID=UPI000D37D475|nr:permease [Aeromonas sp. HMWF014]PTT51625.1 permease [Aeromonas sp. HMWF014]
MTQSTKQPPVSSWHLSDIRELAHLLTQALPAAVQITEAVHQAVLSGMGIRGKAQGQTRGITGLVYKGVHGAAHTLSGGIHALLARFPPTPPLHQIPETPKRAALLATLNGVMGDKLVESHNALATPMTLRYHGEPLDWHAMPSSLPAESRVLLMVHGLCMNDLQWQSQTRGKAKEKTLNLGERLADELGYVPVYVRYNSGLPVAQNGRELASQLAQLTRHWPGQIREISVLAYSMGGLVIRSACHHARQREMDWPDVLKNMVFLGTPHHGAPLEHAGHWLEQLLPATAYTQPFVRLAQLRSAGIKDLRHGKVMDSPPPQGDTHTLPDPRPPMPLPTGVACFTVAATTAAKRGLLADRLIGDGLVPLRSALGQHDEVRHQLAFPPSHYWIAYRTNHMALLGSLQVSRQLLQWFTPVHAECCPSGEHGQNA